MELDNTCMVVECALHKVEDVLRVSIKHLQSLNKIVKIENEGNLKNSKGRE